MGSSSSLPSNPRGTTQSPDAPGCFERLYIQLSARHSMFDLIFGFVLGLGIGAYNAKNGLRDCLDDTFHLSKQKAAEAKTKAGPYAMQARAAAMPYVKQISDNVSKGVASLQQQAGSMRAA
uniref:Uncharacterized protein n=1 Tax=Alexandrium monilatum TaxID=311494 RepID=A0A7S4WF02_9DINO